MNWYRSYDTHHQVDQAALEYARYLNKYLDLQMYQEAQEVQ